MMRARLWSYIKIRRRSELKKRVAVVDENRVLNATS